ncbi:hypothetical protein KJY77_01515 [Canibacter sp. lx-72]|uniref:hypothetical protein n=1 Tax=Canibacter zhuwentaonis TaxID=2837491 RepID=UPI001BDD8466|nr:hypothetical protein [Canibacter zhuwentaonis]MBT1017820.1 hypothetical protein [Canibacter zhuwentaonis]
MDNKTTDCIIRLNPRYAVAWQNEDELRFGFSAPVLVLKNLSPGANTVINALAIGASPARLDIIAKRMNIYGAEFDELMRVLTPVLELLPGAGEPTAAPQKTAEFTVTPPLINDKDAKITAAAIASALIVQGARLSSQSYDAVVTVNRFLINHSDSGYFTRLAIPQIPVVFSDSEVRIGPLISAHGYPCPACVEKQRIASDHNLPVLAAQLMAQQAPTETRANIAQIAPLLAQILSLIAQEAIFELPFEYIFRVSDGIIVPFKNRVDSDPQCPCRYGNIS